MPKRTLFYPLVVFTCVVFLIACTGSKPNAIQTIQVNQTSPPVLTPQVNPEFNPVAPYSSETTNAEQTPQITGINASPPPQTRAILPSETVAEYPGSEDNTPVAVQEVKTGLEATDPAIVQLATGKPQLVEFFAYW